MSDNHRQLPADFLQQLWVTLLRRYRFEKRDNHPSTRDTAAAVTEAHRVVIHGQNHSRNVRGIGIAVFWIDSHCIAPGDGFNTGTVTAPFLLVGQNNQRVPHHRGTFPRRFQVVDGGGGGVVRTCQQAGNGGHHAFTTATGAGHFQEQLPVVTVRQHHK
ncbi:hypothetical protein D3C79_711040 [compost metagenome]